jgi:nucleoside-diphosphate-sugar epimerase
VYGISKQAGEQWCAYYHRRYGVDVRSIRYPGLIGWKSAPGGGTTDYAVHIFHEAIKHGKYTSFLGKDTTLPMMYMPDAIRATIELMEAPAERVKERTSYNLAGFSFNPAEIAAEVKRHVPGFEMAYAPDHRQAIADSWPRSIDDSAARADWGWAPHLRPSGHGGRYDAEPQGDPALRLVRRAEFAETGQGIMPAVYRLWPWSAYRARIYRHGFDSACSVTSDSF